MEINLSNYDALWITLFGEGRGEPIESQIAIANVIKTRSVEQTKKISEICLAKAQFSCWNENDVNYPHLVNLCSNLRIESPIITQLKWISAGILSGALLDNTNGANHYLTAGLFDSDRIPNWAKASEYKIRLGNHIYLWCK